MVRFLWLVKVGHFELQDRVLLVVVLVTTFFWYLVPPKLLDAAQWNFVCCFVMAIPRDVFNDFSKFWIFVDFCLFSLKNIDFSPILNICRSPVKFSMLLHYGNTYIYFQQFLEILNFHWFLGFFWKKHNFFGTVYHLHYQSYPKEIWYAASLWQYLTTSTTIFGIFKFLSIFAVSPGNTHFL